MLKKSYKILKYIYKNPDISKIKICEKFPDFEIYERTILDYVTISDNNVDIEQEYVEKLILEANEKGLKLSEQADYITENMYTCSNKILRGLGKMYSGGGAFTKNIDEYGGAGTAIFVDNAFQIYCDNEH